MSAFPLRRRQVGGQVRGDASLCYNPGAQGGEPLLPTPQLSTVSKDLFWKGKGVSKVMICILLETSWYHRYRLRPLPFSLVIIE